MKQTLVRFLAGLALVSVAPAAHALTVDEVVARHVEARGGLARLHAIRTVRMFATAKFGSGDFTIAASFAQIQKRPGQLRIETTIQGMTAIDGWDGKDGWSVVPFQGRRDAFHVSADDTKDYIEGSDFEGPLVDWRAKGHKVDYLGAEDIDGTPALKLRVALKDGNVRYSYLDPDAFLEIRTVEEAYTRGVARVSESDLSDYRQVAGVWIPFASESGRKGEPRSARFQLERVDVNVDVDDALFRFPAAGTRAARTILAGSEAPPAPAALAEPGPAPTHLVADSGAISGLGARNIGSAAMSGRISAVAAYLEDGKTVLYVGAASGGVWKSLDGGTTFEPVFDRQAVQSIGAIAIDPSSPKTVWVGTGEAWTRNSVSIGDGIYRSTDAGANWTNMGLPDSERITRIIVHPRNSDIVFACVPGKLWSDSADRGLYRTTDGGKHWALVLKGKNLSTGCSGLTIDPKNPDVLFAGLWDFRRKGWTFRSGGDGPDAASGSGLFRTADGGKSWVALTSTANAGIPKGPWGRVEVEIAPSDSKIVYAMIESKDSALYRSADGGATWEERDKSQNMVWRPFYFGRLVIDPSNPDRLFKPDLGLIVSDDGGRSFSRASGGSHGDWHDLWIDPSNPKHVIGGDDGGLWTSFEGGNRWWKSDNLPVSQFYHVSVDSRDPYQVYGGLQDNSSWVGDTSYPGGVTNTRWENLYGGDGFWVFSDPTDPDAVYCEAQGGEIGRVDRKTLASRNIKPTPLYKEKLRFNWNTPIHVSPTQRGTIYIGAQFLFRSRDRGDTWERVSPDLTTNDPAKQKQEESGGVTVDNSSAEMHTTIYSISESPKDPQVVWAGTDDGNLQLTRDGGKSWTNVVGNVKWLRKSSWVSWVEASRYDAGTAYAAFDRHTFGDLEPLVYKTTDYGKTWARIVGAWHGVRGYVHVIKEDTVNPSLLFLGTELGLWISTDAGTHWAEFKGRAFPSVAVRDLQVQPRENDLVISTHGRGIWIIDDLTPLRALTAETLSLSMALLPGRPTQQRIEGSGGWSQGDAKYTGQNPSGGAVVSYYQSARHIYGPIKLEVLDAAGKVIDTLTPTNRRGINRVEWTMHVKPPRVPPAAQVAFGSSQGPRVVPGTYTVRLTKGGKVADAKLAIGLDRRAPYTVEDRKAQFAAVMEAHALFGTMSDLVDRIDSAHAGAEARAKAVPANDPLSARLAGVVRSLEETKRKIVATKEGGAITGEERIREHLDQIYQALTGWEGRPPRYKVEGVETLQRELDDVAKEFEQLIARDIAPLDVELKARHLEPIPTTASLGPDEPVLGGAAAAAVLRCAETHGRDCAESFAAPAREDRD